MIALTIRQPFAELVVQGWKTIENRSARTGLRGRILIHAGKQPHALATPTTIADMKSGRLASMAVIGFVQLVGCHEARGCGCSAAEGAAWAGDAYGMEGDVWHWEFADAHEFTTPIPAKGQLGFWSVASPSVAHLSELAIAEALS